MDDPTSRPALGRTAYLLGFAGLLPQLAILCAAMVDRQSGYSWLALGYASLILSFLGGIWWGVAVRRRAGQGSLLVIAVVPSLLPFGTFLWALFGGFEFRPPLVAVGIALLLTLPVDRRLTRDGEMPPDWMRLRMPLSVGLGLLSIAIAIVER